MIDDTPFRAAPDYTFFHSRQWLDALLRAFPHWRDVSTVVRLPDDRRVYLPLLQTDRVGPWRWLEGMPFGFIGGPVAAAGMLTQADLSAVLSAVNQRAGWLALNLDPVDSLAVPGGIADHAVETHTHLLKLTPDFEAVQRGFSKTMRYDMRRAARDGVTVRRGMTPEDFLNYFELMVGAARARWNLPAPPFPRVLYEALAQLPAEYISLWLADYEGMTIGGLLNMHYHPARTIHWSSALHPDHTALNPTKLLQQAAIREACERGTTVYNMGPSVGYDGQPLDGVRRVKEALGAEPHTYTIPIMMNAWAMRARHLRTLIRRRLPGG
jgi:hypothetical protein